ncbi:hypothetical protein CCM_08232 [Cordyceps militaris CM01]|uniref:Uncharacterized protein n=1 Tax=Cordyceps militaris (strain CM01) TaxID=983644 RepID=G3JNF9_CORMM|nr:uncharacterized protein CCM_08232 [Cordyceps militaris CM01]EGX89978.1 hypothetical protein CCM_08232 [Cordyceps militaris CM01]
MPAFHRPHQLFPQHRDPKIHVSLDRARRRRPRQRNMARSRTAQPRPRIGSRSLQYVSPARGRVLHRALRQHEPACPSAVRSRRRVVVAEHRLPALNPAREVANLGVAQGRLRRGDVDGGAAAAAATLQLLETAAEGVYLEGRRGGGGACHGGLVRRRRAAEVVDAVDGRVPAAVVGRRHVQVAEGLLGVEGLGAAAEAAAQQVEAQPDDGGEQGHADDAGDEDDGVLLRQQHLGQLRRVVWTRMMDYTRCGNNVAEAVEVGNNVALPASSSASFHAFVLGYSLRPADCAGFGGCIALPATGYFLKFPFLELDDSTLAQARALTGSGGPEWGRLEQRSAAYGIRERKESARQLTRLRPYDGRGVAQECGSLALDQCSCLFFATTPIAYPPPPLTGMLSPVRLPHPSSRAPAHLTTQVRRALQPLSLTMASSSRIVLDSAFLRLPCERRVGYCLPPAQSCTLFSMPDAGEALKTSAVLDIMHLA